jgi:hypothetical protein
MATDPDIETPTVDELLGYDRSPDGVLRLGEPFEPAPQKAKAVNILNGLGRPIALHLHETIADDGAGRPFQGRLVKTPVQLNAGHNAGVDNEFWSKWCEQNKGSDLLQFLTAEDETPESAQGAKEQT